MGNRDKSSLWGHDTPPKPKIYVRRNYASNDIAEFWLFVVLSLGQSFAFRLDGKRSVFRHEDMTASEIVKRSSALSDFPIRSCIRRQRSAGMRRQIADSILINPHASAHRLLAPFLAQL